MQGAGSIPWDDRNRLGIFPALWKTVVMVLFRPDEFFRALQVSDSYSSPRNFFVLAQIINFCILSVIHFLFNLSGAPAVYLFMLVVFVPIMMLILLLITAVTHVFVRLVGGNKKFLGTFHVLAYSSVTGFLQVIPRGGMLISLIWGLYVGTIGLRRVHGLSVPRAALVCAMPSVLALSLMFTYAWAPRHYRWRNVDKNDREIQVTLRQLSAALENYAGHHEGRYPAGLDHLKAGPPTLPSRYCGANKGGFLISCQLAEDGYVLTATPIIIEKTGTTTFTVATGGVTTPPF